LVSIVSIPASAPIGAEAHRSHYGEIDQTNRPDKSTMLRITPNTLNIDEDGED
jgi:hypothetical protein